MQYVKTMHYHIVARDEDGRWYLNINGSWENRKENGTTFYGPFAHSIMADDGLTGPNRSRPYLVEVNE